MYLIRMPDIKEAKCFEFTVQILPPPLAAPRGGKQICWRFAQLSPPQDLFLYTPLLTKN